MNAYAAHVGHPAAEWISAQFGPMVASAGHRISHNGNGVLFLDGGTLGFLRGNPPDSDGYVSAVGGQMCIWISGVSYPLRPRELAAFLRATEDVDAVSKHMFLVTVKVTGWDSDRDPADYATTALLTAGLPEAARLDGFADLSAEADIVDVEGFQ